MWDFDLRVLAVVFVAVVCFIFMVLYWIYEANESKKGKANALREVEDERRELHKEYQEKFAQLEQERREFALREEALEERRKALVVVENNVRDLLGVRKIEDVHFANGKFSVLYPTDDDNLPDKPNKEAIILHIINTKLNGVCSIRRIKEAVAQFNDELEFIGSNFRISGYGVGATIDKFKFNSGNGFPIIRFKRSDSERVNGQKRKYDDYIIVPCTTKGGSSFVFVDIRDLFWGKVPLVSVKNGVLTDLKPIFDTLNRVLNLV